MHLCSRFSPGKVARLLLKETCKSYSNRSRACLVTHRSRGWAEVWLACCGNDYRLH
jgi:hypothetical protein